MRMLFLALGWLSLGLGFIGIFLPLLPTTPLVILAAFLFSKGSDRLHRWLRYHPKFGSLVQDWEDNGVIRTKPKILATVMIVILFGYTLGFVKVPLAIKAIVTCIGIGVLWFILSRPSQPRPRSDAS